VLFCALSPFGRTFVVLAAVVALAGCVDPPTEHRVRANAYLRAGDATRALGEVDAGLAKTPNDLPLMIMRGKALFELERYDDARVAFRQALDHGASNDRSRAESYLGLAMAALRLADTKEARAALEALVKLDPSDADAKLNLARVCLQTNDLGCALRHAEEAARLRGNAEEVLFTLGRIYAVNKKLDEAEQTFAHICEVAPNAASCPYGLALVAAQRGDSERALEKLGEAVAKKLPSPDKLALDTLLAPLAADARFKALIEQAKR
jgi:tetratricopeptide (TPR) repeat protein